MFKLLLKFLGLDKSVESSNVGLNFDGTTPEASIKLSKQEQLSKRQVHKNKNSIRHTIKYGTSCSKARIKSRNDYLHDYTQRIYGSDSDASTSSSSYDICSSSSSGD